MSIFQDGGCGRSILFPVSHLLMSLYSKGQNLSANQISRLFPVSKNKSSPYWNTTSGFYLDHIAIIDVLFCIRLPNFVQIGPPTAVIWRHIDFATWRSPPLNTISGFVFVDVSLLQTKFRRHISIHGWFRKTNVHFRFRSRPFRRNRHVILHQAAEFRPNRTTQRVNMTSLYNIFRHIGLFIEVIGFSAYFIFLFS